MDLTQQTFRITSKTLGFLAILVLVLAIVAIFLGNDLVLPWYSIPTYVKTPLFLEYFSIGDKAFGLEVDQVLAWQHFSTGNFTYLAWLDYLVLGTLFIALIAISVTLTYLHRSWYLFCAGLMLLILMQLNLGELGLLPDYITYIFFALFIGISYYFQSIKTGISLVFRVLSFVVAYALFGLVLAWQAPIIAPASAAVAFGLFTPLLLAAILMIFVGGDTMQVLWSIATKNNPNGKNGLIHFISISLIYIILLVLLFLDKTGNISLDLWLFNPYVVLMASLLCGHLSLKAKLQVSESELPVPLISKWLFPAMATLCLSIVTYIELSGNDSLSQAFQLIILATQMAGAIVFFFYALINFTPQLLTNEKVPNFFAGFRAPLLTARVLQLVFITGVFFYLDSQPYYQARAGRYIALGALAESLDSDLLAKQYYKQANFYDYYNFKANYTLARIANREKIDSELIENYTKAAVNDRSNKATLALANFYSDRDQLFNKLLTLKEAAIVDYRLTNNLGIAHFEFAHYDSSQMAFDRSLELQAMAEAETNRLALSYYLPALQPEEAEEAASINAQINQQAIANKAGLSLPVTLELKADTILYQEDLFELHNLGLNRAHEDEAVQAAYEYYLAARHNTGMKDFLLVGQAIQAYDAGLVNLAFKNISELMVIDTRNQHRHAFTLGLWAAQQGAHYLALEHLSTAIRGQYRTVDAMALIEAMQAGSVPQPERTSLKRPSGTLSKSQIQRLKDQALKNAFNTRLTLDVLSVLKEEEQPALALYEFLRESIIVNPYNLELTKAFAMQSVEAGLSSFGRNALLSLQAYVGEERLNEAMAEFDTFLEAWRVQLDEQ